MENEYKETKNWTETAWLYYSNVKKPITFYVKWNSQSDRIWQNWAVQTRLH